jgi:hypothetical protein
LNSDKQASVEINKCETDLKKINEFAVNQQMIHGEPDSLYL